MGAVVYSRAAGVYLRVWGYIYRGGAYLRVVGLYLRVGDGRAHCPGVGGHAI